MEDKSRIWGISDVKAFLISIITGFILLTIVAVIFTEISNETVNKTADRVLACCTKKHKHNINLRKCS